MSSKRKATTQLAPDVTDVQFVYSSDDDSSDNIQLNVGYTGHLNSFDSAKVGTYDYSLDDQQSKRKKTDKSVQKSNESTLPMKPVATVKKSDAISIDDLSDDMEFESSYIVSGSHTDASKQDDSDHDVLFFDDSDSDLAPMNTSHMSMSAEDALVALGGEVVDTHALIAASLKRQARKNGPIKRMQCYNCREVGHTSRDCPQDKSTLPCNICAIPGHNKASACPSELCVRCCNSGHRVDRCVSRRITQCFRCGSPYHDVAQCDVRASIGYFDKLKEHCKCVTCGKYGHTDCTESERKTYFDDCINCGVRGHTYQACPESHSSHRGSYTGSYQSNRGGSEHKSSREKYKSSREFSSREYSSSHSGSGGKNSREFTKKSNHGNLNNKNHSNSNNNKKRR